MANKQSPFQNVRVVFQPGNPKLKKRLIALILASLVFRYGADLEEKAAGLGEHAAQPEEKTAQL